MDFVTSVVPILHLQDVNLACKCYPVGGLFVVFVSEKSCLCLTGDSFPISDVRSALDLVHACGSD